MFTGRRLDPETRSDAFSGLYYYRARMVNPQLARFMQTDPIGYYDSMNLYQYAFNSPTNYLDPMGLCGKGYRTIKTIEWSCYHEIKVPIQEEENDIFLSQYWANEPDPEMRKKIGMVMGWAKIAEFGTAGIYATYYGAKPVKVGRWMSEDEYNAMNESGYVQKGGGNTTYVTRPSNPAAYTASDPGTIFVEFEVSPADLRSAGKSSWNQIPGPGNIYSEKSIGGSIRYPVPAKNIKKTGLVR